MEVISIPHMNTTGHNQTDTMISEAKANHSTKHQVVLLVAITLYIIMILFSIKTIDVILTRYLRYRGTQREAGDQPLAELSTSQIEL